MVENKMIEFAAQNDGFLMLKNFKMKICAQKSIVSKREVKHMDFILKIKVCVNYLYYYIVFMLYFTNHFLLIFDSAFTGSL